MSGDLLQIHTRTLTEQKIGRQQSDAGQHPSQQDAQQRRRPHHRVMGVGDIDQQDKQPGQDEQRRQLQGAYFVRV